MLRRLKRLILLAFVGAALAYGGLYFLHQDFFKPGPSTAATRVTVEPGASVRAILTRLDDQGVIRNARMTEWYLRLRKQRPNIQVGMYEIPAQASPAQIVELFRAGRVILEQLTIVEGSTFAEARRVLEQHPEVQNTLKGKTDAEVMAALGHAGEHPEGRFFPDTYRFASRTTDAEILRIAYVAMSQLLEKAWAEKKPDLPVKTAYEALVLASVVEKETGLPAERPRIAGVFTTRLRQGMKLQSDPTIIYGLGEKYDGDIRSRDLVTDTPYNTYTRAGLPPTPIALPGREAVMAAVRPDETGDIFFVATGDGTGSHVFSRTLEEHNEAVRKYLARLRAPPPSRSTLQRDNTK